MQVKWTLSMWAYTYLNTHAQPSNNIETHFYHYFFANLVGTNFGSPRNV